MVKLYISLSFFLKGGTGKEQDEAERMAENDPAEREETQRMQTVELILFGVQVEYTFRTAHDRETRY